MAAGVENGGEYAGLAGILMKWMNELRIHPLRFGEWLDSFLEES